MTSFIFIKMLSLQALHSSFVNPPFDLYLIFSFHISLDSFSVPQKVYDKLTVVVLICLPMSLYVLHRLSSHVIKKILSYHLCVPIRLPKVSFSLHVIIDSHIVSTCSQLSPNLKICRAPQNSDSVTNVG